MLAQHGKSGSDVMWVGDNQTCIDWGTFYELINFDYDAGYGSQNINRHLIVCGLDWWLERHEYDGSEWWEYKELPEIPVSRGNIKIKE